MSTLPYNTSFNSHLTFPDTTVNFEHMTSLELSNSVTSSVLSEEVEIFSGRVAALEKDGAEKLWAGAGVCRV